MIARLANSNRSLMLASLLAFVSAPALNVIAEKTACSPKVLEMRIGYHLATGEVETATKLIEVRNHLLHQCPQHKPQA